MKMQYVNLKHQLGNLDLVKDVLAKVISKDSIRKRKACEI